LIALACDHGGFGLMREVMGFLDSRGFEYKDFGTFSEEDCDYPEFTYLAASAISSGECDRGIFICGTGIGMSIAANKVPGIRAAVCFDNFTVRMARSHNDANVVCLGARVIDAALAIEIVDLFLSTVFDGALRHVRRVGLINAIDERKGFV